ncbi:MAG TPA: hypothetical protein VGE74_26050 [Gemmata sp.]
MNPAVILEVLGSLEKLKDTLLGVVNAVMPFVQALAPSVVNEFNAAMKDLQATIGSALIGIVQVAASVVRELGGVLLPVMQQLEPIVTAAANAIGTVFVGVIRLAVVPLQLLVPVLDLLVGLLSEYGKLLGDYTAIAAALAKTLVSLLHSFFGTDTKNLKEIFKQFFDVVRQVVKALITLAATLAVAAGAAGFVNRFADALGQEAKERDERAGGLKAAGTNPNFVDAAGIAKSAQLAAFTAQGSSGGREKTDTEYLKELSADLKRIATSNDSLEKALANWWDKQVIGNGGIFGKVLHLFDSISATFKAAVDRIARASFLG